MSNNCIGLLASIGRPHATLDYTSSPKPNSSDRNRPTILSAKPQIYHFFLLANYAVYNR